MQSSQGTQRDPAERARQRQLWRQSLLAQVQPRVEDVQRANDQVRRANQQLRVALEQVYETGIQVFANPAILGHPSYEAIDILFVYCPMNTHDQVNLAFEVLTRKVQSILQQRNRASAGLLVDISGMYPGKDMADYWGSQLRQFLSQVCLELHAGQGDYLIARYKDLAQAPGIRPQTRTVTEYLRDAAISIQAVRQQMTSNVYEWREEAISQLRARLALRLVEDGASSLPPEQVPFTPGGF